MRKSYLLFILLSTFSYNVFSQQYFFRNFSINEGLPQSTVYCMLQDSRGYIWMGTNGGGVCKYDGRSIEIINKADGLTGNIIRSLFEDSRGNIWIGTDNGITFYDGYEYNPISEKEGFIGSFTLRVYESKNGAIWVATNDAGLYKIQQTDSLNIVNYSISDGLLNNFIIDIHEDEKGRIWLAMIGGINILQFNDKSVNITKLIQGRDIPSDFIICIESNNSGELLFGTNGNGAFKITNPKELESFEVIEIENKIIPANTTVWDILHRNNGETWFATNDYGIITIDDLNTVNNFNKENALETNQILDILEDREGNLWFSTMGAGTYMFSNDELISYQKKDGIPDNKITSIYYNKNLYIGTSEGLAEYNISHNLLKLVNLYDTKKGLTDNHINSITKDQNNNILIGTNNGLNIINKKQIRTLHTNDGLTSNKINCLLIDKNNIVWVGTDDGYNKIVDNSIYSFTQDQGFINSEVQAIIEDKNGQIWMGTYGGLVRLNDAIYTDFDEEEGLNALRIYSLAEDRLGNIWIGTFGGGLYKFDQNEDSLPIRLIADKQLLSSNNIYSLVFINDTSLIVGTDKGFDYLFLDKNFALTKVIHYDSNDGFVGGENNLNAISKDSEGNIWFGTIGGLIKYNPNNVFTKKNLPQIYITNLKLFFENVDWNSRKVQTNKWFTIPENLELSYKENHITFDFSAIYFEDPQDLEYTYFLEGQSKVWSPYTKSSEVVFQGLSPGNYTFKVRAKNKYDLISSTDELNFYIKPPFYKTAWFIITASIILIIAIIFFIRYRESKLKKEKIKLEKIIHERTKEIVKQKDKIAMQRDVVTYQKQEITDSISYAQTIQKAVLPKEEVLKEVFSDYFILFRPKDIVSGDFYWMSKKNNHVIFTAADCTGHGVPGAFMSMLGVSFLNKIVNEQSIIQPNIILNKLRENIIDSLQQKGFSEENQDGMDISICSINIENKKLQFAGANNPMLLIKKRNKEIILDEIKADRMPVAIYSIMNDFTNIEIQLEKGDAIYLFSDGFIDQFGGPKGKKFMKKNFKDLILENQNKDMTGQKDILTQNIEDWMKYKTNSNSSFEQIDDIIVLGVEI